jgi:hypothetical protein
LVWVAAIAAGLGVAVVVWWVQGREVAGDEPLAAASTPSSPSLGRMSGAAMPVTSLSEPAPILPDGRPADLTDEEWRALQETVGKGPNAQAEMKRVMAYLRFQKGFTQWQAQQETSQDPAQRKVLAQQLLAAVPERLKQSEVTIGEALMLAAALYNDIEPDETTRSIKLEQFRVKLEAVAPRADNAAEVREASCLAEYKRREAIIQQDFISRPDGQRDHKKFEAELEAAHRAVYEGVDCR